MTQSLVQGIIDALSGSVGKEAIVFIISMIPILELRGALKQISNGWCRFSLFIL